MTADPLEGTIDRYLAGTLSAPLTLMHLLIAQPDAAIVEAAVRRRTAGATADPARVAALRRLVEAERDRLVAMAELLRDRIEHATVAATQAEGLETCRALFDRLARSCPEAGAALYSLGSPALLAEFTAEIVDCLHDWRLLSRRCRVLDLGCGFGRIAAALAPRVASVVAIDLSQEMIAQARARYGNQPNLRFVLGAGDGLAGIADASIDLCLAVDSFPYIVQCGDALARHHIREVARVLAASGDLVIFNYSYRGVAADRRDIAALARDNGLALRRNGQRCFSLWDGAAFHLRRARRKGRDSARPSALR